MGDEQESSNPTFTHTRVFISLKLTEEQKASGRKLYQIFAMANGASFATAGDSVVILYALAIGMPPWLVALTSSFIFLTLPFMLVGKKLAAARGAVRTLSHAWLSRVGFASLLLLIPYVSQSVSLAAGGILLVISTFGYWASRAVGVLALYPIVGEITSKEERGRFNARIFASFYTTYLLASLFIVALFHLSGAPLWAFQTLICLGCSLGLFGSIIVTRIPETDISRRSAAYPIGMHVSMIASSPIIRHITIAWAVCSSASALIGPFMMLALKKGYLVQDAHAMMFAIIQIFGGLLASLSIGRILARTGGPRPLIIVCFCGFFLPVLMWLAAPASFTPLYCVVVFLLVGACSSGVELSLSSYFLHAAPDNHRLGLTLIVMSISGLTAGVSGSLIGAGLLKALSGTADSPLALYKHYFGVILVLLLAGFIAIAKLDKLRITHAGKYIGIFFSMLTFGFLWPRRLEDEEDGEEE